MIRSARIAGFGARCLLLLALLPNAIISAGERAAQTASALRASALDPAECYRVRDLNFSREDARFYFTDGYVIFAKPVNGRHVAAVFVDEVEGGDGEILLLPPHRGERVALAAFTKSPNLNEHFHSMLMVFTDDTANELRERIAERARQVPEAPGRNAEMGALLAGRWNPILQNFFSSFEVRLVENLLAPRPAAENFFYAAIAGKLLGNFDFIYDPRTREQITVGQLAFLDGRSYFNTWTSFEARSFRRGGRRPAAALWTTRAVRIDAAFDANLRLSASTTLTIEPAARIEGAIPLEISRQMTVPEARLDGEPVEVFQRDSMRANLIRGPDNGTFLVIPSHPLEPGRSYALEIKHEGEIVTSAGDGVYFVGSRATWYPKRELQFAPYELTFRYPKSLNLVATGDVVEDSTEGDFRVTRHKTSAPVRFAGFNLGEYHHANASQGGYTVEVYGNRKIEKGLQPKPRPMVILPEPGLPSRGMRRPPEIVAIPVDPPAPNPTARLSQLASEVASALNFMASRFGPPAFQRLTVSPIPGFFGQGFPGLIYLSTISYLDPAQRPVASQQQAEQLFFSDILQAHEAAHQWWGNVVATSDYQDDWLMEALANYSALLYLEKKRGPRVMDNVLEGYKNNLLKQDAEGRTLESAGPITWSLRLQSSQSPRAWATITYQKGAWIIHMLRRRMGDGRFFPMLAELCRRYRFKSIDTNAFRSLAVEFMPKDVPDRNLEGFFEQWVYSTGIPSLKFTYSVKGKAPALKLTGTVTQSDVADDCSVLVPVEIQLAKGKTIVEWVETGDEPATFTRNLPQLPLRVQLDAFNGVLARKTAPGTPRLPAH